MSLTINRLTKAQCVLILKEITGSGGDYARTSLETYRDRVKTLRRANPAQVDALLLSLKTGLSADKDARIKELEAALDWQINYCAKQAHCNTDEAALWAQAEINARRALKGQA